MLDDVIFTAWILSPKKDKATMQASNIMRHLEEMLKAIARLKTTLGEDIQ